MKNNTNTSPIQIARENDQEDFIRWGKSLANQYFIERTSIHLESQYSADVGLKDVESKESDLQQLAYLY